MRPRDDVLDCLVVEAAHGGGTRRFHDLALVVDRGDFGLIAELHPARLGRDRQRHVCQTVLRRKISNLCVMLIRRLTEEVDHRRKLFVVVVRNKLVELLGQTGQVVTGRLGKNQGDRTAAEPSRITQCFADTDTVVSACALDARVRADRRTCGQPACRPFRLNTRGSRAQQQSSARPTTNGFHTLYPLFPKNTQLNQITASAGAQRAFLEPRSSNDLWYLTDQGRRSEVFPPSDGC